MKLKMHRRSTTMDQQGQIFVNRDIVKAMGLLGGGKIEWFINVDGHAAFRKANPTKNAT